MARNTYGALRSAAAAAALLAALGSLAGCSGPQDDGGPPASAAGQAGGAAANPFGKTSTETKLPPQGRPPEAGEDIGARARAAGTGRSGQPSTQ